MLYLIINKERNEIESSRHHFSQKYANLTGYDNLSAICDISLCHVSKKN